MEGKAHTGNGQNTTPSKTLSAHHEQVDCHGSAAGKPLGWYWIYIIYIYIWKQNVWIKETFGSTHDIIAGLNWIYSSVLRGFTETATCACSYVSGTFI